MLQQQDSSSGVPPYRGSYESFLVTAGHGQPLSSGHRQPLSSGHGQSHSSGHDPVLQSAGYDRTSPRRSMYQPAPVVPPEQMTQPSSGGPSRGDSPLVQPTVPLSTRPEAIAPAPRRLSAALGATPLPMWVELARSSAVSPTVESSNSKPDSASIQGQPRVDASGDATGSRPRPRSIHDPRYYTAADFYGLSPLPQGPFHRNDS